MSKRRFGWIAALAASLLSTVAAAGGCQLALLGDLPVDMRASRPLVWTKINGVKARFVLSTGAFYSVISHDAAAQYRLRTTSMPDGYHLRFIGGSQTPQVTTVKSFQFLSVSQSNVQFLVIDRNMGSDLVGFLGQNMLRMSDVEYDLANGIVRFFKPADCEHQPLAYWATSTPYSSVELRVMDAFQTHLLATAKVNGHPITVMFDTGSSRSALSLDAAERAGISPNSPGVKFLGLNGNFGPSSSKIWSVPVDTFELGGEKVQHAQLLIMDFDPHHQIGDVSDSMADMILGEDFFLSHRIYVAYGQRKLYFTYNGGPLFNLNLPQTASSAAEPPATPGAAPQTSAAPTDSDGFRRRGMAFASMREWDRAIADLTRACELAPRDEQNHYQRGVIYLGEGQFKAALQDFNAALTLQPGDIQAHVERAELLQSHPDAEPTDAVPVAKSDLDAVSRLATPDASERLTAGVLYGRLGDYSKAVAQIEQWLGHHPLKNDQATGLNSLCWLRATGDRDLHEALDDCSRALDLNPHEAEAETGSLIGRNIAWDNTHILDSRALVYLRLGRPEDAINDYTAALRANPRMPTSLYGRGLAELRLGEKAEGQDDLAAAEKLDSGIAKYFAKMGLAP